MYRYIVFLSVILILAFLWIKLTNIANKNIEPLDCRKSDITPKKNNNNYLIIILIILIILLLFIFFLIFTKYLI